MKNITKTRFFKIFLAGLFCTFECAIADEFTDKSRKASVVGTSTLSSPLEEATSPIIVPVSPTSQRIPERPKMEEDFNSSDMDLHFVNPQKENDLKAYWKTAFKTKMFSDKSTANSIVSTEIYSKLKWRLVDTLSFQTQGLIIGRSGFTQSIYEREDRVRGFYLLEGFFQWKLFPNVSMQLGNIQQSFLDAPLLITDKTFPSIIGKLSLNNPYGDLFFLFQTAIPDNASEFVRRETQIVRGFPLFLTSSAVFHSPKFLLNSSVKEMITLFYYHNLSSAVADRSRIYGNTIERTGSDSTFKYPYFGIHNNLSMKMILSDLWILEMGGEFLYNFMAPNTYNEGMRIFSSAYHNYENFMEIQFIGEFFVNQSDTSVAYYNSELYGHNDRRGFLTKLQSHFYNSSLTLGVSFVYSLPINNPDKSPIGNSFSFIVSLMTNYIAI